MKSFVSETSQSALSTSDDHAQHDKYTNDNVKFAIGETGWGQSADISTRLAYVQEITSDETLSALPNFVGATWFNFMKGSVQFSTKCEPLTDHTPACLCRYDFRIVRQKSK